VVSGAVGAEILQDAGERCFRHADLEEVVAKWDLTNRSVRELEKGWRGAYHAIIRTRFTTEVQRLL
jgi:hypothetical protein